MALMIAVVLGLFIWIGSVLYNSMVLYLIWGWCIVPAFHLHPLTLWQAAGLGLVMFHLTHQINTYTTMDTEETRRYWMGILLTPLYVLLMGWIISKFL